MTKKIEQKVKKYSEIINVLNKMESYFNESGINYRKNFMLPTIDSLFKKEIKNNSIFMKKIENNLKIYFTLTSRITKDFLLSKNPIPDHINEPQTTELINRISKKNKNKNLIFGGTFIGDMAIPISKNYKNNKLNNKIHCFEIDTSPLKLLRMNISKNKIKNINVINLALYKKDNSYLNFEIKSDSLTKLISKKKNTSKTGIKTITLDTYCKSKKIDKISLIHLDIEGAELDALKGADRLLSKSKLESPDIVFEYCTYYVSKKYIHPKKSEICNLLKKYGYKIYAIRDFSSNIGKKLKNVEIIDIKDIHLKNVPHCYNVYATKNIENIKKYNLILLKNLHPKLMWHESKKLFWPKNK